MQLHDPSRAAYSTADRINHWIDRTAKCAARKQRPAASPRDSPASPQYPSPKRYNTRKRIADQGQAPCTHPSKRQRIDKRRALVNTSGNKMPSQNASDASMGGNLHREPEKKPSLLIGRGRRYGEEDSSLIEPDEIPVSIMKSAPSLSNPGGSTTIGSSRARSKSPAKKFTDWEIAEWPVLRKALDGHTAEKAGGFLTKYKGLRAASEGDAVIPKSLKASINHVVHKLDQPKARHFSKDAGSDYDKEVWESALKIRKGALDCDFNNLPEAAWNSKVHEPILELVVGHPKYIGAVSCHNITTARIWPRSLAAQHANGDDWESKMVDFAVSLNPDSDIKKRIGRTVNALPQGQRYLNQTDFDALSFEPIVFNVETKIPFTGGQKADLQLTGWQDAGETKLKQLLAANGNGDAQIPTMPLVSFYGYDAFISGWHIHDTGRLMIGKFRLGSVENILGIFQILKALDIVVSWGNDEYRKWYLKYVLKP